MNISRLNILVWLPVYIMLLGCQHKSPDNPDGLAVIDMVNNLGTYQRIPVSEFVSEFEYIPLETNKDCLIGEENMNIIVTSTHIFVQGFKYCYAFSRSGRFIGKIGSSGQGPGEYIYLTGISIDKINRSIYLDSFRSLLEYSWDNKFHQSIQKPSTSTGGGGLTQSFFVRDSFFIGHDDNNYGNAMYGFQLYNKSGQVVKSFENHVRIDPDRPGGNILANKAMKPFRMGERIYVKEKWNDTLFYLDAQNDLVPQFVFDLGKYAISKEKRTVTLSSGEVTSRLSDGTIEIPFELLPMTGIPDHIFFSYVVNDVSAFHMSFPEKPQHKPVIPAGAQIIRYVDNRRLVGIYDIASQKTRLLDTDPVSQMTGLINDLDGGLSFWPKYYTSDNELVDVWQAYEMKEVLTEKYFAAHKINNPQAHQKLKAFLKDLKDDDNPVIVIGKLK